MCVVAHGRVMRSVAGMAVFCTGCLPFVGCSSNSKDVTRQEVCPSRPPVTPSTVSPMVAWNAKYRALDDKRVQLEHAGRRLTDELNSARTAAHSSTVATIDAKRQAIVRQINDVQKRILDLVNERPSAASPRDSATLLPCVDQTLGTSTSVKTAP